MAVCNFMSDILNKAIVLVLNRNWQAINTRTPQEAFCMMATNVATALEIEGEVPTESESDSFCTLHSSFSTSKVRPVAWDEWITLPIRPQDNAVRTVRGPIRVPTVIVAINYARVPRKRPLHSRARPQRLPVHRPHPAAGGRQPGPRRATLARRQGQSGQLGLGEQGG